MRKLSFLELEREMKVMTEEENFRTKAGGDPKDCAFKSMHRIMTQKYGFHNNLTEQGLEDLYNDFRNSNDNIDDKYINYADVTGLQNINKMNGGLGWINNCLSNNYNDGAGSFSATYVNGNSFPNTTAPGESNQYMPIVDTGEDIHAVVFRKINAEGQYECYDPQLGAKVTYPPSAVKGAVVFHEQPTTTIPTTTYPTTT